MVARFQSGDGPPIFLLSLKAGGTGLNLTAANHVVHLDGPGVSDRAAAHGAGPQVHLHRHPRGEDRRNDRGEKGAGDLVVTDGEGWLTELSTRDLREVFALSEGAVGE